MTVGRGKNFEEKETKAILEILKNTKLFITVKLKNTDNIMIVGNMIILKNLSDV